jgi:hypothetical protein
MEVYYQWKVQTGYFLEKISAQTVFEFISLSLDELSGS